MGVANLPSTGDYWSSHPCMPQHSAMTKLGMSEEEEGYDKENISEEEDTTDELYLERVVRNEEEDECESDEEDEEDCNDGESDEGSP
eukprot:5232611-Ditylum_brightwellii.AAC.1